MASYLGLDEFLGSSIGILPFPLSTSHSFKEDNIADFSPMRSISGKADEDTILK
jgi:hypothetical protein